MKIILFFFFTLNLFGYERIVALSPAINEIVYELGAGGKIVGNTEFCNFPQQAIQKPKVGGYFSPSLEKILSLKPDIVIMQENNLALSYKLNKLHIQTKVVKIDTINSIKKTIVELGILLRNTKKAQGINSNIERSLKSLNGAIKHKKILIAIGYNTNLSKEIYVAGQNLYFDDIIKASGNINALQSSRKGQPIVNMEKILAMNPDIVIILASRLHDKGLKNEDLIRPWKSLPINASKTNSIFVQSNDYAGIPSGRVVHFIKDFKGYLVETRNK